MHMRAHTKHNETIHTAAKCTIKHPKITSAIHARVRFAPHLSKCEEKRRFATYASHACARLARTLNTQRSAARNYSKESGPGFDCIFACTMHFHARVCVCVRSRTRSVNKVLKFSRKVRRTRGGEDDRTVAHRAYAHDDQRNQKAVRVLC